LQAETFDVSMQQQRGDGEVDRADFEGAGPASQGAQL
jgi:hypothetical protein